MQLRRAGKENQAGEHQMSVPHCRQEEADCGLGRGWQRRTGSQCSLWKGKLDEGQEQGDIGRPARKSLHRSAQELMKD